MPPFFLLASLFGSLRRSADHAIPTEYKTHSVACLNYSLAMKIRVLLDFSIGFVLEHVPLRIDASAILCKRSTRTFICDVGHSVELNDCSRCQFRIETSTDTLENASLRLSQ